MAATQRQLDHARPVATEPPSEITRKQPGRASSSVEYAPTVIGSKFGGEKHRRNHPSLTDNKGFKAGILVSPIVREEIEAQLLRLYHRRDPRKLARTIARRTRVPQPIVEYIIAGLMNQYRAECLHLRKSMATALSSVDEVGRQTWKAGAA